MDDNIPPIFLRALGTLVIDEGVIIRAYPDGDDRTIIEVAPSLIAGAIVRNPQTGRWRYDSEMRAFLGIVGDPDFPTDHEAGDELEEWLPPLSQVRARVLGNL